MPFRSVVSEYQDVAAIYKVTNEQECQLNA